MKALQRTLALFLTSLLLACGGSPSKQPANADGFASIEKELKSKFGDNAYYTDVTITYNEAIGNIIGVTVTEDPASLKMGQWNNTQGNWQQHQDITIEIPQDTKAADFMFQLDNAINLSKLGELVETASKKLTTEKNIENPVLSMAHVKFPKNGDASKGEYVVMLNPKNGGTTFTFRYALNGAFIDMDY